MKRALALTISLMLAAVNSGWAAEAQVPAKPAISPAPGAPKVSYTLFHINTNAIALTFDDGPHKTLTPRLLGILKERGIKATFFLIGKNVANFPEVARQISDAGHQVANHTWSHANLRKLSEARVNEELQKTHDAIVAACGVAPVIYRPPFGAVTKKQEQAIMDKFHYSTVLWEVDTRDWQPPRKAEKVHDAIMKDTHAGSIILCHEIHETTIDAMPGTLDELKAKGFQFLTISEMMKLEADTFKAPVGSPAAPPPASTTPPSPPPTPPPAPEKKPKTEAAGRTSSVG